MADPEYKFDDLLKDIGQLVLAMGVLDLTLIEMHAGMEGVAICEIDGLLTDKHIDGLKSSLKDFDLANETRERFRSLLIRAKAASKKRHSLIHMAVGVSDGNALPGVPKGAFVNLKTFGLGIKEQRDGGVVIGVVGQEIRHSDFESLINEIASVTTGLFEIWTNLEKRPMGIGDFIKLFTAKEVGKRIR